MDLTCSISNILLQHALAQVFFLSVLIKGLKQLHENQKNNPGHQLSENKSGSGLPNTNSSSGVQHVQIRVARLEESAGNAPSPMAALQIPVQITHVCKYWNEQLTVLWWNVKLSYVKVEWACLKRSLLILLWSCCNFSLRISAFHLPDSNFVRQMSLLLGQ